MSYTVSKEIGERMIVEMEGMELEIRERVQALRAGEPGSMKMRTRKWLVDLKKRFPEVPDELIARIVPTGTWSGELLPWNRRQRKSFATAKSLILPLFSGGDQRWWVKELSQAGRAVLSVDREADARQDLLNDGVMSFLAELCEGGGVDCVLGGPPCRTVSKLRHRQPGPPPLRTREGPERFGIQSLPGELLEQAWGDAVLWFRMLWLYSLAQEAKPTKKVLFLKENPRDPQEWKDPQDSTDYASFFAWPEWKTFVKEYKLWELKVDFGALGHARRKPSTLGTNMALLRHLDGVRGRGCGDDQIEDSLQVSKTWAAWPLKFKLEVVNAIKQELDDPMVKKLSHEQWKQHLAMDHMPFSRHCYECQKGAGKARPHHRVPHPDTFTLSLDVCGAFEKGIDVDGRSGKYFVVGVFTIPVTKEGQKYHPVPPDIGQALGKEGCEQPEGEPEELLPPLEEAEVAPVDDGDHPEDAAALEKWEA